MNLPSLQFFLGESGEADWDQFMETVYPKMKPFLMMEKGLFQPPSEQVSKLYGIGIGNRDYFGSSLQDGLTVRNL